MKMKKMFLAIALVAFILLSSIIPAFASSSTVIEYSSGNVKVGDLITVTVRFKGAEIGGCQFDLSYDEFILSYQKCSGSGNTTFDKGRVISYADKGTKSSYYVSLTFKALSAGETSTYVKNVKVSDGNAKAISGFSGASAKLTVKGTAATVTTTAPAKSTTKTPATTVPATTVPATTVPATTKAGEAAVSYKITFKGVEYEIVDDSAFIEAPSGFNEIYSSYKGGKILSYISYDLSQRIVCLTGADNKKFFVLYDEKNESFDQFTEIESNSFSLILLTVPEASVLDGYEKTNIKIGNVEVVSYQNSYFKSNNRYLIYALKDGKADYFMYDIEDNTFQRYIENEPVVKTEVSVKTKTLGDILSNLNDNIMLVACCVAAGLLLLFLIIIIFLSVKLRKTKKRLSRCSTVAQSKNKNDNGYDEYIINFND